MRRIWISIFTLSMSGLLAACMTTGSTQQAPLSGAFIVEDRAPSQREVREFSSVNRNLNQSVNPHQRAEAEPPAPQAARRELCHAVSAELRRSTRFRCLRGADSPCAKGWPEGSTFQLVSNCHEALGLLEDTRDLKRRSPYCRDKAKESQALVQALDGVLLCLQSKASECALKAPNGKPVANFEKSLQRARRYLGPLRAEAAALYKACQVEDREAPEGGNSQAPKTGHGAP